MQINKNTHFAKNIYATSVSQEYVNEEKRRNNVEKKNLS